MKRAKVVIPLFWIILSFCSSGGQTGNSQPEPAAPPPPGPSKVWVELAGSATAGGVSNTSGDSSVPSVAVDQSGNPIVAWMDNSSGNYQVYVRRWDGTKWAEMGAGSASGGGISGSSKEASWPSIAVRTSGNPVVAWMDSSSGRYQIYVKRWNGTSWVEVGAGSARGSGISGSGKGAMRPSLAIDSFDNPVVAWYDSGPEVNDVYIKKFRDGKWVEVGRGSASGSGISYAKKYAALPSMALGISDFPIVAWQNNISSRNSEVYVKRFDGKNWVEAGDGSASLGGVSNNRGMSSDVALGLDAAGNPIVAWADNSSGRFEIYVKGRSGGSWEEIGRGSDSSKGISANQGVSGYPSIAVDSTGKPLVAWTDNRSGKLKICLMRWDGSQWLDAGPGFAPGEKNVGVYLDVALDSTDSPIVAWMDKSSGKYQIYLKRWMP